MKYLILTQPSIEYAKAVSGAIWQARYPDEVRDGDEATHYYCGWIVHPQSGDVALAFPDENLIVHPMRKLQPLVDIIKAPLPENEKQAIQDHFDNLFPREEGDPPLTIENVLPSLYAGNLKTHAQMDALGWFKNEN